MTTAILTTLAINDPAPAFDRPTDGDRQVKLSDLSGKKVVLYFYPKDSTPGCTTEGKDFAALHDQFTAVNTVVLGASKDSVKRHDNFKTKYEFPFTLLSDEDGSLCEAYGVWVLKKNYGREYMGIERATFLIDENGKIAEIWRKVRVKDHAEKVLAVAQALS